MSERMRRWAGPLALVAVGCAFAWPMQVNGFNQTAHYALVKALADGVPYIDDTIREVGELGSQDVARSEGHLYTVKAPGLAMAAQPAYAAVEAVGMRTTGDPTRAIWVLNLATSVLASIALLFLVRAVVERIEPGLGTAAAVMLGLGALTLPFATLFFSHALGTALAFAAFATLLRERGGAANASLVGLAGLLAGLAVVVEHAAGLIAGVLAVYAASRLPRLRRLAAYSGGALVGVAPLFAFNLWAFGSLTHTPYEDYWKVNPAVPEPFTRPSWDEISRMLLSSMGLPVLAPVVAAAAIGVVLLFRGGRRAEALVLAVVPLAFFAYFAGFGAFGGLGPPRYLTPIMPFLALGIAVALRAFPLTTLATAAIGSFQAVVMTATGPLAAYDGEWLSRVGDKQFVSTAASLVDVTGWYAIAPYFLAVAAAIVSAAVATGRLPVSGRDALLAAAAVSAWALAAFVAPNDYGRDPTAAFVLGAALAVGAAAGLSLVQSARPPLRRRDA